MIDRIVFFTSATRVAELLLKWPETNFSDIAADASWWIKEGAASLDENLLWPLWDRIAEGSSQDATEASGDDVLTASLNHPSGRLADILLRRLTKGPEGHELPEALRARLDKLVSAAGVFGHLARVRLAAEVSLLFEHAPQWTEQDILSLFDWSLPDTGAAWSARKYANYIGSPRLFLLTKRSFLALFGRVEIADEDLGV